MWLPILIVVIGIVANLLMDFLTASGLIGPQFGFEYYAIRMLALALMAFPALYSIRRGEKREGARLRREKLDDLSRVLEASVRRLFPNENQYFVRANVMVAHGDRLEVLSSWNMAAWPDSRMNLGYDQGVAGKVWKSAIKNPPSECWQPVYAPYEQLQRRNLEDHWGLSTEDISKTSHIRWILSTPLLYRQAETLRFIGVLNLDGVTSDLNSMDVFENHQFHLHCVAVADHVTKLIEEGSLLNRT